jgi:alpha-tubulin suppressor-like RCC1 family protein
MAARTVWLTAWVTAAALGIAHGGVAQQPLTASTVSAGDIHTCALTTDGRAYCWGNNEMGALGTAGVPGCMPSDERCVRPVPVSTDLRFATISAGYEHTCALTVDSIPWCWGSNALGELGFEPVAGVQCGSKGVSCGRVPSRVPTDLKFAKIIAGLYETCALDSNGRAYCWGLRNFAPQSQTCNWGNPPKHSACDYHPTLVDSTTKFLTFDLKLGNMCALRSDRARFCWGRDYGTSGRLLGAAAGHLDYVDVRLGTEERECNLIDNGDVSCGGYWPDQVFGFYIADSGFVALSMGRTHACGLQRDGRAYCWGNNREGELGVGRAGLDFIIPQRRGGNSMRVATDSALQLLSCGGGHTCAVTAGGSVLCWGRNDDGQLGNGSTKNQDRPTPVAAPAADK